MHSFGWMDGCYLFKTFFLFYYFDFSVFVNIFDFCVNQISVGPFSVSFTVMGLK